jgi:predicted transcriptional regulator
MTIVPKDRRDEDEYVPTPEEEAEIEAGFAEIERGEWIDGDEVQRELRRRRGLTE